MAGFVCFGFATVTAFCCPEAPKPHHPGSGLAQSLEGSCSGSGQFGVDSENQEIFLRTTALLWLLSR